MSKEYKVDRDKISRAPLHPGVLLADVAESSGLNVTEWARRIGVTRQSVHNIISGKNRLSAELALRIGKLFGNGPNVWMNMQSRYDLWTAQQLIQDDLEEIEKVAA